MTPPATIPTPDANRAADTGGAQNVKKDAAISRAPTTVCKTPARLLPTITGAIMMSPLP